MPRPNPSPPSLQNQTSEPARPDGYSALPARFKDYIRGLEQKLHAFKDLHAEMPESRVMIASYTAPTPRYLADDTRLVFRIDSGRIEAQIETRRGTKAVSISSPDGRLEILPEVSNEVGIRIGRY